MSEDLLESIALGLLGPATGRPRAPLVLTYMRDMLLEDVVGLAAPDRPFLAPASEAVETLKHRHHLLARVIAAGAQNIAASAETGYSLGTILKLSKSPAFQELVEYYKSVSEQKLLDLSERRATVGIAALEEIQERLEDDTLRKALSMKELRELVATTLGDRVAPQPLSNPNGSGSATHLHVSFTTPSPLTEHNGSGSPLRGRGTVLELSVEKEESLV